MNCDDRTSGKLAMALQHGARVLFESEKQDTNGPGVTVTVTLYNYAQYIEGALDSVFKQIHSNIELIVVDDASQDGSQIVARRWMEKNAARFTRIKLLAYGGNCGLAHARNTAFANATNDYVFVLDSDNEIHPDAITKLLAACVSENAEVPTA